MMYRRQEKRKTQASHADDWLMTYADVITLLLCFFAIILIVSVSKKNVLPKVQVQQIVEEAKPLPVQLPENVRNVFQGNLPFHDIEQADQPEEAADPVQAKIDETPPQIAIAPAPSSEAEKNPPAQVPANFEQKGDRIATFEESNAAFFTSGSSVLSGTGISILRSMAADLKSDKFKDYQITVEGHTDDTPIQTAQFPSNWELSTARAAAVVRFFLDQGIPAQRLRAAGYADTFSKVPNRDANGNPIPANQAQNRRVVIKLEKIEKE
jgi:chemotaxis protein MotB